MSDHQVVFGDILKIVFDHIHESPRTLAEMYIDRDRSLVYKWLNHTALPTKKLIPGIVRFICDNTNEPVRMHPMSSV